MRNYLFITMISLFIQAQLVAKPLDWSINAESSQIEVTGTSTMHDWSMQVAGREMTVEAVIEGNALQKLRLEIPVKAIKSEHELMNEKTYEALEAGTYPKIVFEASGFQTSQKPAIKNAVLHLHGKRKNLQIQELNVQHQNNQLILTGSYPLNMKDFAVDPPSVFFMTVGETVQINVRLVFAKADESPSTAK